MYFVKSWLITTGASRNWDYSLFIYLVIFGWKNELYYVMWVCVYVHKHIWISEVNHKCKSLGTCFGGRISSLALGSLILLGRLASWPWSHGVSVSPVLELQMYGTIHGTGDQTLVLVFVGKYFTYWAISLALTSGHLDCEQSSWAAWTWEGGVEVQDGSPIQ